ncbi:MAG: Gfo/Idh/MocA family oxidoreductase [Chloroflexi bacterium]|nr:Gfo/Idh/MocA family oxidoreductase [Chloroflexota bacterium]
MKTIGIGLIGCGATEWMFGPCFRFLSEAHLIAAVDPNPVALQRMLQSHPGLTGYTNDDDLLADPRVDAVIVGSPVQYHAGQVVKAARAGKHVLCEKPMAPTVADCDRMIDACERAGVVLMVALVKRFDQSMNYVKQLIDSGQLGSVFQVSVEWSWPQYFTAGGRDKLANGGGLFQDHGAHAVDLCRWWLGEFASVSGEIAVLLREREVEDQALVLYRHVNGAISYQQHCRMTHKPLIERYQIDATLGTLIVEYPGWSGPDRAPYRMTLYRDGSVDRAIVENRTFAREALPDEYFDKHDAYLGELRHFCRAVRGWELLRVSGADGRKAIEAITAAYVSSWKREKVLLPLQYTGPLDDAFRAARRDICSAS